VAGPIKQVRRGAVIPERRESGGIPA
jgi:hypothetical protein